MSRYNAPRQQLAYFARSPKYRPWEHSQQELTIFDEEWFRSRSGNLSALHIRRGFRNHFIDVDIARDLVLKWKNESLFLWLDGFDCMHEYVSSIFVKAAKRGNDVYKERVAHKFKFLEELPPVYFFEEWGVKQTPMLFITLTVDAKRFVLVDAWDAISYELHLFETKLRQKYGSFVKLRVWEAHESGYPHVHLTVCFHKKWFQVFEHLDKKGKQTFRVANKHRDAIKSMWGMGHNVDVQGVQDTSGALSEVVKYVTKTIFSPKGENTMAMLTLFNKQAYSLSCCNPYDAKAMRQGILKWRSTKSGNIISAELSIEKDFVGTIWGMKEYLRLYNVFNDGAAEPSAAALVNTAMHNCNIDIVEFKFVGCVSHDDLRLFGIDPADQWFFEAKPPPELRAYADLMRDELKIKWDDSLKRSDVALSDVDDID